MVLGGGEVKRFVSGNTIYAVVKMLIVGVVDGGQVKLGQPMFWYATRALAKLQDA